MSGKPLAAGGFLEKIFKLKAKNTNVKTEIIAGFTTFLAMSYILVVNPGILAEAGIPKEAAIAATIYAAVFGSLLMGLWANFPVGVAPGMGLNMFFTHTVVKDMGLNWETALGAVFISGIVFLVLTLGGIRQAIIKAVPMNLKCAIGVGIGLFIAFIGFRNAGLVVYSGNVNLTTLGNLRAVEPLLVCLGVLITGVLIARNVKGAMLIGIVILTILGMVLGVGKIPQGLTDVVHFTPPSLAETFMKMDIKAALAYGIMPIIFTFTIVELFDNMGTLIGVTKKAKLMDDKGNIENLDKALTSDAIGTMISATCGTSTVTAYVESAAGVAEGGRTGLTAVVVAVLFLMALFFAPFIELVPAFATAPALILVGGIMLSEVPSVKFDDFTEAIPAFLTIIIMPITNNIANGLAFGFISYSFLKLLSGRYKEVTWVMWLISLAFVVNFTLRSHH